MAEFEGTQIGPDGKRYNVGSVPSLNRSDVVGQEYHVYGTPGVGKSVQWNNTKQRAEWTAGGGGGGGGVTYGAGLAREQSEILTLTAFPGAGSGAVGMTFDTEIPPATPGEGNISNPWAAGYVTHELVAADSPDLEIFGNPVGPLSVFTFEEAGWYEIYFEVDFQTQTAPERAINIYTPGLLTIPRDDVDDNGTRYANLNVPIDSGDDGYVLWTMNKVIPAGSKFALLFSGSFAEYDNVPPDPLPNWTFDVTWAEIVIKRIA